MTATFQPSFAGGIMSSGMYARNDVVKYQVGLKDALNVFIRPQGGLSNRAGFRVVGADPSTAGRQVLIPFEFSADEGYQLEFTGDGKFRVLHMGGYVLDPVFGTKTAAYTPDGTYTLAGHGLAAGDVVEVRNIPDGSGSMVVRVGGVTPDTFNVEGLGTRSTVGGDVQIVRAYSGSHPYSASDLPEVQYAQDANDIYLAHQNHPPHKLRRLGHANWQSAPVVFAPGIGPPSAAVAAVAITDIESNTNPWFTAPGHGLAVGDAVLFTADAWDSGSPWGRIVQGVFVVKEVSGTRVRLRRVDGGPPLDTTPVAFANAPPNPRFHRAGVGLRWPADAAQTPNPDELRYAVASVNADGEESEAVVVGFARLDLTFAGAQVTPLWHKRPGAERYIVYRQIGGEFGYIGSTPDTWFADSNIAPDMSQGPQKSRNPFNAPGDYPAVVAFHEQRLFYGATKNDPQRVEGSQSGRPNNFSVSRPPRPSDAVAFRPRYRQVNAIRALVSGPQLILLTGGGEWVVSGGGDGGALTPDNLFLHPISYWGADAVPPLLIGDVLAFVQRGGRTIRDFPLRGGDNEASRPTDLTIMAPDLFTAPVTSWCFAQVPDGVVWVALEDGSVLSLTYLAEHDVWGWTRHQLGGGGRVRQFSACMEAGRDVVYAVVERTTGNGTVVSRAERLDLRSDDPVEGLYLDNGVTIRNATDQWAVGGLRVLAGRTVTAVVDGRVIENLTVTANGTLELPAPTLGGKVWHVGLPYLTEAETLPIDFGEVRDLGATTGRYKRLNGVAVQVAKTRGVMVGRDRGALEEAREWGQRLDELKLHTTVLNVPVQGDWLREANIVVRHPYPLPFTLLSVAPDWELGA